MMKNSEGLEFYKGLRVTYHYTLPKVVARQAIINFAKVYIKI